MSAPPKKRSWSWRSKAFRSLIYQVTALVLIFAAGAYLLHNTLDNMRLRGIKSGFDFIAQPAGFAIGESIVSFDSAESYGKAFLVGLSNTLRVALAGIVLAVLRPQWSVPSQLWLTMPYVVAILVLAGFVGRTHLPAALGVPYRRAP